MRQIEFSKQINIAVMTYDLKNIFLELCNVFMCIHQGIFVLRCMFAFEICCDYIVEISICFSALV